MQGLLGLGLGLGLALPLTLTLTLTKSLLGLRGVVMDDAVDERLVRGGVRASARVRGGVRARARVRVGVALALTRPLPVRLPPPLPLRRAPS